VKDPVFSIGEIVFYYNKWNNEIEKGEIINIRQAKYNWDYNIRYEIYSDMYYIHWIEEKYIDRKNKNLLEYLK